MDPLGYTQHTNCAQNHWLTISLMVLDFIELDRTVWSPLILSYLAL